MRVVLAVPYDGNDPDSTVDVDDATARTLIGQGRARLPESKGGKGEKGADDAEKVADAVREKVAADESTAAPA